MALPFLPMAVVSPKTTLGLTMFSSKVKMAFSVRA